MWTAVYLIKECLQVAINDSRVLGSEVYKPTPYRYLVYLGCRE